MSQVRSGIKTLGFTIVELLIVIVVIAILAAIVIVSYRGITQSAAESGIKSSLKATSLGLENYKAKNDRYPTSLSLADVRSGGSDNVDLTYNPSGDGLSYCLAGSRDDVSLGFTNASKSATKGECSGTTFIASGGESPSTTISRVSAGSNTSFSGSYAAGDLIVVLAVNTGSPTVPSTPAGYTMSTSAQQSANSFAMAVFYKFATSSAESYPSIPNSVRSIWAIYRGVNSTPFTSIGGQSGSSSSISYSGVVSFQNPGDDWVILMATASNNSGLLSTHAANSSSLVTSAAASNYELAIFDSGAPVSSYGFNSKTLSGSTNWLTKTIEVVKK